MRTPYPVFRNKNFSRFALLTSTLKKKKILTARIEDTEGAFSDCFEWFGLLLLHRCFCLVLLAISMLNSKCREKSLKENGCTGWWISVICRSFVVVRRASSPGKMVHFLRTVQTGAYFSLKSVSTLPLRRPWLCFKFRRSARYTAKVNGSVSGTEVIFPRAPCYPGLDNLWSLLPRCTPWWRSNCSSIIKFVMPSGILHDVDAIASFSLYLGANWTRL
jgi:hypothetical protein